MLGFGLIVLQTNTGSFGNYQSYALTCSLLAVVILAGRYMEIVLRRESNSHLSALYEIQTEKEKYQPYESALLVPASLLKKGDEVLIPPNATIPCDCYVTSGKSAVDEASITGEANPVSRSVGDFLLAGSRNMSHTLRVVISLDQSESTLAKIIEGVSAATEQRLDGIESLDTILRIFVYGVILLAIVAFMYTFANHSEAQFLSASVAAFERSITILAAACPCGIGLAIPSAAMAGVDAAYSKGILLRGGIRTMDALHKTTHIVMDKTGTLTEGNLNVTNYHFEEGGLEVTMLTGDAACEASRISTLLNMPVLASRASPSDKMCHIQTIRNQGHRVVMVGDGINDSLAQAAADVELFSISRKVMAQAKMNIRWALIYNIIALTLATGLFSRWGIVITA
ncbi:hypothetical protein EK21DRAFT_55193 [Setomelanomma holmii]|uniref:P-type ATPase A domain-containing protein n=1 Tax=Setomelanomma holmii TaxID=210430 RepID=A0A9P4HKS4_9PLEO|nr:hypothetical protein EK21DRAFT_55193 [Setomelanomma holmii]